MFSTPRFEYSKKILSDKISEVTSLKAPYGYTPRYAVKANTHPSIITIIDEGGIHFDASSSYEAMLLLSLGVSGEKIALSSQQSAHNLDELLEAGVRVAATSFKQLEMLLAAPHCPEKITVRINPDYGSGHNNRTSTGGTNASFGIWHEYIPEIVRLCATAGVKIDCVHIHVGSGAKPEIWAEVMDRCLKVLEAFPTATILNVGGGFKVHRFNTEEETDLATIFEIFTQKLTAFKTETNRSIHLEIEPGTYLVAHAGTLVATIDDIVDTGENGHTFIKLDTGMNDFLRTTMYGSQHKIEVMTDNTNEKPYVVVGHNCESGDIFTTVQYDQETIKPRLLKEAKIGDEVRIYDTGAYCASMRAKGYNAFPDAIEIMVA